MRIGTAGWWVWSIGLASAACGDDTAATGAGSTSSASTGEAGSTGAPTSAADDTTTSASGLSATGGGTTETSLAPTTGPDGTTEELSTTGDETSSASTGDETTGAAPFCGDGEVDAGEACDLGADNSDAGVCTSQCTQAVCGDGLVGPGEACDDANADDADACTNACALASCGDGAVQPGEDCDDGDADDTDECLATCVAASCGDGFVQAGVEACDDGDADETDECLATCAVAVCGDGAVQAGVEACDDGDADDTDECLATCVAASCGDGFVQAGVEECDDANADESDECSACKDASCEDSLKNGGETDVDCGGSCGGCGLGLACGGHGDCGDDLLCGAGVCSYPHSCKALKEAIPATPSGEATIDLDGGGPEAPLAVYCEQTQFGGGWTRLMSAKYPHFFNDMTWESFNANAPGGENYSIVGKRNLFKVGNTYTYRYDVGNLMTWKDGPILFKVAWTQAHDAFTATTNGGDYTYVAGDKPTTCGGFNGLHAKYSAPSYATDVDQGDNLNCWWMQVVPRDDWADLGYPPGYLHGFLGGGNLDPKHETQWEVLYIRE